MPLVILLSALLGAVFPSQARAQNRADLQVAAQVLATGPSQGANLRIGLVVSGGYRSVDTLATIEVLAIPTPERADSLADRPRAVVAISFLRN
jgi:hypothetical protein